MRVAVALLSLAAGINPFPATAAAAPLELLETSPRIDAPVAVRTSVYLHIAYQLDQPARIGAELLVDGQPIPKAPVFSGGYQLVPAGEGAALLWFEAQQPLRVDAIRLIALDPKEWSNRLAAVDVPAAITWSVDGATASSSPAWVERLRAVQQQQQAAERAARKSDGPLWEIFSLLTFLCVPGYLLMQWLAWRRLRGGLRILGMLPLPFVLIAYGITVVGLAKGSNIAPIYIYFASLPAALYLLLILIVARFVRRTEE